MGSGKLTYVADDWTDCSQYSVLGNLLLYKAYPWKQGVMGIRPGVYLYNLSTGETKTLIAPDSMRTGVVSLLDEKTALIAATDDSYKDTTKYCDFYHMDLADGSMKLIHPYESSIGGSSVGSDSRFGAGQTFKAVGGEFYYISTVGDFSHLYKISRGGTVSGPLTAGSSCDSFDVAGGHIASMEFHGLHIAELFVDGEQVTHMNDWLTDEYDVQTPEAFSFTASDGYEIHGWVLKPAGFEEGKSYPGILTIHGGPRTVYSDVYYHEMQMWANRGYFVFFCNPRGSDGRGTDFGNINGIYGTVDYQNLMDFTDEVLRRYPMIDPEHLGVAGGSYGGFMTNWIIGHTDRFRLSDMLCTTKGQVNVSMPGALSIMQENVNQLDEWASKREAFLSKGKKTVQAKMLDLLGLKGLPDHKIRIEATGHDSMREYEQYKFQLIREGEMPVPCILIIPSRANADSPVELRLQEEGKGTYLSEYANFAAALTEGKILLLADLRGLGETTDPAFYTDAKYWNREYRNAMISMHIGRPIMGQRVVDILTLLDFCSEHEFLKGHSVKVFANGIYGPAAIHAAYLDERINSVEITHSVKTWKEYIERPMQWDMYSNVLYGALKYYDLPDLIRLSNRSIRFAD